MKACRFFLIAAKPPHNKTQAMNKDNRTIFTYNITFVMSPNAEEDFKEWLNGASAGTLSSSSICGSRLQKVVEIGGEKPGPDHGLSVALQVDLQCKEEADKWASETLPALLNGFMAKFGPSAAYFTTLLETTAFH